MKQLARTFKDINISSFLPAAFLSSGDRFRCFHGQGSTAIRIPAARRGSGMVPSAAAREM
jgi:hypothetical protein